MVGREEGGGQPREPHPHICLAKSSGKDGKDGLPTDTAEFTTGLQGRVAIPSIVFPVRFILRSSFVASFDLAN